MGGKFFENLQQYTELKKTKTLHQGFEVFLDKLEFVSGMISCEVLGE